MLLVGMRRITRAEERRSGRHWSKRRKGPPDRGTHESNLERLQDGPGGEADSGERVQWTGEHVERTRGRRGGIIKKGGRPGGRTGVLSVHGSRHPSRHALWERPSRISTTGATRPTPCEQLALVVRLWLFRRGGAVALRPARASGEGGWCEHEDRTVCWHVRAAQQDSHCPGRDGTGCSNASSAPRVGLLSQYRQVRE